MQNPIDEYLKNLDAEDREELDRVRSIVKKIVPDATEVITYDMPGFKYKGKYLIAFGAFKNHYSLFPGTLPIETLGNDLKGYTISKGTIQYKNAYEMPETLVGKIVQSRLSQIK